MYIGDLHIHSKYSRATSRELSPEHLDLWARKKGIHILGTGDFTHPAWRKELEEKLEPAEQGLYKLKDEFIIKQTVAGRPAPPRFVISGEISSIYKKNGRVRKVHSLILLPSLETAEILSRRLEAIGNLHSDGRPILGLDCHDLLAITLEACPEAIYVPAHIWTPHFSLFGAFSGFDTIEECYEELTPQIHALETGLSSDPAMNWRLSALDSYQLISNSDAHSPSKLGREANLFDIGMSYNGLYEAIQKGKGLSGTIEFFPEEGKYHFDGHRKCHLCLSPSEAEKYHGICPVCGKKLTTGVLHRVEQLADRQENFKPAGGRPYENLIPLPEVIAAASDISAASAKVSRQYEHILAELGNEFSVLRQVSLGDIESVAGRLVSEGVRRLREGKIDWRPGFDGEYGRFLLLDRPDPNEVAGQLSFLSDLILKAPEENAAQNPSAQAIAETAAAQAPDSAALTPSPATYDSEAGAESLNSGQQQAVQSFAPATAVIAGPGTGKTKTLVSRIVYLIKERGVKPSEITAVTFTKKAAEELKLRLKLLLPGKRNLNQIQVGTFHSICFKILKEHGVEFSLAGEEQIFECALQVIDELQLPVQPSGLLSRISARKSEADHIVTGLDNVSFEKALETYTGKLAAKKLLDFDDLLLNALELSDSGAESAGARRSFHYLLVDEFQDVNPVQYRLIRSWSKNGRELFVIGDPDQAIYSFRGSDSRCFERLMEEYPNAAALYLKPNYRSTPEILSAALALISHNPGEPRSLVPVLPSGAPVRLSLAQSSLSEAIFIAKEINRLVGGIDMLDAHNQGGDNRERPKSFSDIAILYRTNRQATLLEQCLQKEGIPYIVAGREDYLLSGFVRGTVLFFKSISEHFSLAAPEKSVEDLQKYLSPAFDYDSMRELYAPRFKREKPWKLLIDWADRLGIADDSSMLSFIRMSYFHKNMEEMLENLMFGQEGDLKRSSQNTYLSDAVTLMTFHASKGLEFPTVFLYGVRQGIIPLKTGAAAADPEEERRLLYVAMTRAREELILTASETPSAFIDEIPPELYEKELALGPGSQIKQLSLFDFM